MRNNSRLPLPAELNVLQEISAKLDKILALLAISGKDELSQIAVLRALHYDWNMIGEMLGMNPDAARMRFKRTLKGAKI